MHEWETFKIAGQDADVTWYEIGRGPEVLFLHGNLDHVLYMPMLAEQGDSFRSVLLKQRGADCWQSPQGYNALPLEPFLEDIERLRAHKGRHRLRIVGHSWGATLALEYASRYPDRVSALVLIGMGPISDQMSEYYRANCVKMVPPDQRERFDRLKRRFRREFASGQGVSEETDRAYAEVYSHVWAYSAESAREIARQFLEAGGFRRVAAGAPRGDPRELLARAERIQCPTLILYGYQDYEPITQAYVLEEHIAHAEIAFINRCGHYPWIDQPTEFYCILQAFIT
jgi:proline iminopeptidase